MDKLETGNLCRLADRPGLWVVDDIARNFLSKGKIMQICVNDVCGLHGRQGPWIIDGRIDNGGRPMLRLKPLDGAKAPIDMHMSEAAYRLSLFYRPRTGDVVCEYPVTAHCI
jgi:hypothetical protein